MERLRRVGALRSFVIFAVVALTTVGMLTIGAADVVLPTRPA